MRKRKPNGIVNASEPTAPLREAMLQQNKAELVDILLELAQTNRRILRQLVARFEITLPPDELVAETRKAISDATAFDVRQMNRNFDYDYAAYEAVNRNFSRLVASGHLPLAMDLALELMKRGSHQVEMSDEGIMTGDIETCLEVVLESVKNSALPTPKVIAWCSAMLVSDRVKFIATEQLKMLRKQFQASARR